MLKFVLTILFVLTTHMSAETFIIEFLFDTTAEVTDKPRIVERETRMELTFDTTAGKGTVKSYSPFSDSFETHNVTVMPAGKGMHFIEDTINGFGILSFSLKSGKASYSRTSIVYGALTSFQLYGTGRLLQEK